MFVCSPRKYVCSILSEKSVFQNNTQYDSTCKRTTRVYVVTYMRNYSYCACYTYAYICLWEQTVWKDLIHHQNINNGYSGKSERWGIAGDFYISGLLDNIPFSGTGLEYFAISKHYKKFYSMEFPFEAEIHQAPYFLFTRQLLRVKHYTKHYKHQFI